MNNTRGLKLKNLIQTHYDNVAGIVVMKNNKIEFESYFNEYSKDDTLHISSLTKSIISLLMGIALDRGVIKSIEQKVLDFFPTYKIKRGEKTIQDITIRHLLTMTAPYKFTYEPYTKVGGVILHLDLYHVQRIELN